MSKLLSPIEACLSEGSPSPSLEEEDAAFAPLSRDKPGTTADTLTAAACGGGDDEAVEKERRKKSGGSDTGSGATQTAAWVTSPLRLSSGGGPSGSSSGSRFQREETFNHLSPPISAPSLPRPETIQLPHREDDDDDGDNNNNDNRSGGGGDGHREQWRAIPLDGAAHLLVLSSDPKPSRDCRPPPQPHSEAGRPPSLADTRKVREDEAAAASLLRRPSLREEIVDSSGSDHPSCGSGREAMPSAASVARGLSFVESLLFTCEDDEQGPLEGGAESTARPPSLAPDPSSLSSKHTSRHCHLGATASGGGDNGNGSTSSSDSLEAEANRGGRRATSAKEAPESSSPSSPSPSLSPVRRDPTTATLPSGVSTIGKGQREEKDTFASRRAATEKVLKEAETALSQQRGRVGSSPPPSGGRARPRSSPDAPPSKAPTPAPRRATTARQPLQGALSSPPRQLRVPSDVQASPMAASSRTPRDDERAGRSSPRHQRFGAGARCSSSSLPPPPPPLPDAPLASFGSTPSLDRVLALCPRAVQAALGCSERESAVARRGSPSEGGEDGSGGEEEDATVSPVRFVLWSRPEVVWRARSEEEEGEEDGEEEEEAERGQHRHGSFQPTRQSTGDSPLLESALRCGELPQAKRTLLSMSTESWRAGHQSVLLEVRDRSRTTTALERWTRQQRTRSRSEERARRSQGSTSGPTPVPQFRDAGSHSSASSPPAVDRRGRPSPRWNARRSPGRAVGVAAVPARAARSHLSADGRDQERGPSALKATPRERREASPSRTSPIARPRSTYRRTPDASHERRPPPGSRAGEGRAPPPRQRTGAIRLRRDGERPSARPQQRPMPPPAAQESLSHHRAASPSRSPRKVPAKEGTRGLPRAAACAAPPRRREEDSQRTAGAPPRHLTNKADNVSSSPQTLAQRSPTTTATTSLEAEPRAAPPGARRRSASSSRSRSNTQPPEVMAAAADTRGPTLSAVGAACVGGADGTGGAADPPLAKRSPSAAAAKLNAFRVSSTEASFERAKAALAAASAITAARAVTSHT